MNILSYEVKNNQIHVTTDYESRPVFVYKVDKFSSLVELQREIERSILHENRRKDKKDSKLLKLQQELDTMIGGK